MGNYTFELPDWLKGYLVSSLVMLVVCGMILNGGRLLGCFFLLDGALLLLLLAGELCRIRLIRGETAGILTPIILLGLLFLAIHGIGK